MQNGMTDKQFLTLLKMLLKLLESNNIEKAKETLKDLIKNY